MRTTTLLAGFLLAGSLYAQEVDVCSEIYAPWGSSAAEVIRSGAKANLSFREVTKQNADGVSQVTFIDGVVVRVFTLMHGKFVSFSLLYIDADAGKRNKYTSKQMLNVMAQQAEIDDDGAWVITCGESTVKATMETTSEQSTFRVTSITALKEIVNSRR